MPHFSLLSLIPPLLRDITLKSLPLLAVAALTCLALRRASAAARHAVWLTVLAALLILPIFCLLLPPWSAPLLPNPPTKPAYVAAPPPVIPASQPLALPTAPAMPASLPAAPLPTATLPAVSNPPADTHAVPPVLLSPTVLPHAPRIRRLTPAPAVTLLWLLGTFLVLGRLLLGLVSAARLVRFCRPVTIPTLTDAADTACRTLGLTRPVALRTGPVAVPMTCGLLRPVILLPADADTWPEGRLRAVLLHEAAHIRRGDWTTGLLAQSVCALYWFHPGVWLAARRGKAEAETACDDLVLGCGLPAPDYAAHLLAVVQSLSQRRSVPAGTVAMARRPDVSTRLQTILDTSRSRRPLPRRALVFTILIALALLAPLAALRPVVAEKQPLPVEETKQHSSGFTNSEYPFIRTVCWQDDTKSFDPRGRLLWYGHPTPIQYWVRQNPPAMAMLRQASGFKTLDDKRGGLERTGQGNYLMDPLQHDQLVEEINIFIGECINLPKLHPCHTRSLIITCTPWQKRQSTLHNRPMLLYTSTQCIDVLVGKTPHLMLRQRFLNLRWVDKATGRLLEDQRIDKSYNGDGSFRGTIVYTDDNYRYNQTAPPGVFDWSPPPGAKVIYPNKKNPVASRPAAAARNKADFLAGLTAVQGPGVIVTLRDSHKPVPGAKLIPATAMPNLIHAADLNILVNTLKAAGAEAISVNDQRLVATTAIYGKGTLIVVNQIAEAPPYIIRAIGNPTVLKAALNQHGGYTSAIRDFDPKMIQIAVSPQLRLPAFRGNVSDQYAKPVQATGKTGSGSGNSPRHILMSISILTRTAGAIIQGTGSGVQMHNLGSSRPLDLAYDMKTLKIASVKAAQWHLYDAAGNELTLLDEAHHPVIILNRTPYSTSLQSGTGPLAETIALPAHALLIFNKVQYPMTITGRSNPQVAYRMSIPQTNLPLTIIRSADSEGSSAAYGPETTNTDFDM